MKTLLLICCTLLTCSIAFSQTAEETRRLEELDILEIDGKRLGFFATKDC